MLIWERHNYSIDCLYGSRLMLGVMMGDEGRRRSLYRGRRRCSAYSTLYTYPIHSWLCQATCAQQPQILYEKGTSYRQKVLPRRSKEIHTSTRGSCLRMYKTKPSRSRPWTIFSHIVFELKHALSDMCQGDRTDKHIQPYSSWQLHA